MIPPTPTSAKPPTWGPVLVVRALFDQLGLWGILDQYLGQAKGVPFADRDFVLVANRLIAPASEHGLAGWLETDFVCDRTGRRFLPAPTGTTRAPGSASIPASSTPGTAPSISSTPPRSRSKWRMYHRLRDLFSLKPDLVLYDITSTYFEGKAARFRQARLQPRRQVAERAGDRRHGDGRGLADRPSCLGGQPHRPFYSSRSHHQLAQRFEFGRLVFVGDRGMVTDENIESITKDEHGFLVGIKRRRNAKLDAWLDAVNDTKWIDSPAASIPGNGRPTRRDPRQEVPSGDPDLRVIVIDSDDPRLRAGEA